MIQIHIITGFLGSGKTTFIKKLLLSEQDHQTLVLINELGEIGIDNILVQTVHENTYLLPNGCICCTVLTDLKQTLLSVLNSRNKKEIPFFDRIVIETTGMANPASVIRTIQHDIHLKGLFLVKGLSTIVDTENGILQSKLHPEWTAQIIAAQQVLLSKTDRVDEQVLISIQQEIFELYPDINLANVNEINSIDQLFKHDLVEVKSRPHMRIFNQNEKQIHQKVQSFVIQYQEKIDWMQMGIWLSLLLKKHGEKILRIKGFLHLNDIDQPILIQGVQHCLYPPEHLVEWPWEDQYSRLVFIVRDIDIELLKKSFSLFMRKVS